MVDEDHGAVGMRDALESGGAKDLNGERTGAVLGEADVHGDDDVLAGADLAAHVRRDDFFR